MTLIKKGINKRFNLADQSIGGIIDIHILNNSIIISNIDNITRKKLKSLTTSTKLNNPSIIIDFLLTITNQNNANIITEYISNKIKSQTI